MFRTFCPLFFFLIKRFGFCPLFGTLFLGQKSIFLFFGTKIYLIHYIFFLRQSTQLSELRRFRYFLGGVDFFLTKKALFNLGHYCTWPYFLPTFSEHYSADMTLVYLNIFNLTYNSIIINYYLCIYEMDNHGSLVRHCFDDSTMAHHPFYWSSLWLVGSSRLVCKIPGLL